MAPRIGWHIDAMHIGNICGACGTNVSEDLCETRAGVSAMMRSLDDRCALAQRTHGACVEPIEAEDGCLHGGK